MTPTAPEHILSTLIDRNFKDGDGRIDTAVIIRNTFDTLTLLGEIWSDSDSEITYLYLSFTLLVLDKTLRTLAAELWIKAVSEGTMNAELLGQTLGRLEHGDYAPLKRFTDLIHAYMLNITSLHNRALEAVLAQMIIAMHDTPIKGVKKLLEIYLELLVSNQSRVQQDVVEKLEGWKRVKSLNGIIRKLEALKI